MALKNRKQEETSQLKGVDLVDEETDLPLGAFTHLANFIPAEVYSLKKKRGVLALDDGVCTEILAPILTDLGIPITDENGEFLLA